MGWLCKEHCVTGMRRLCVLSTSFVISVAPLSPPPRTDFFSSSSSSLLHGTHTNEETHHPRMRKRSPGGGLPHDATSAGHFCFCFFFVVVVNTGAKTKTTKEKGLSRSRSI
jgi:hypothetical protein